MEERRACGQTGRPGETLQAAGRAQREPEIHTDRTAPGVQSTGLLRRCGAHTSLYPEVGGLGRGAAPAREGGSERAKVQTTPVLPLRGGGESGGGERRSGRLPIGTAALAQCWSDGGARDVRKSIRARKSSGAEVARRYLSPFLLALPLPDLALGLLLSSVFPSSGPARRGGEALPGGGKPRWAAGLTGEGRVRGRCPEPGVAPGLLLQEALSPMRSSRPRIAAGEVL